MRQALLTTAMLCAAVTGAAQSHEPAAKGGAKVAPVVSRITASPKATPQPAAEHDDAVAHGGAASAGKPKPLVSGAGRAPHVSRVSPSAAAEHAPAEHAPAVHAPVSAHGVEPAAAAVKAPAVKGPVALATVHGRLTAALAELHEAPTRLRRSGPAPPRYTLTWPVARWRVAWRDGSERVVVSWPE